LLAVTPADVADSTFEMEDARNPQAESLAREICDSVLANLKEIDGLITECLKNWTLSRLSSVERNLLRIALTEGLYQPDEPTPARVCIDEAIDIAKIYAGPDSGSFINGVLDTAFRKRGILE